MEAANMAALWKLPVVYLCEENKYAEFSPSLPFIAVDRIQDKAFGFGIAGETVDGNDVLAVYAAMRHAVARAREGSGPTLLVAQTYRIEGHTVGDPLTYRPEGEAEVWKSPERDPIARFGRTLAAEAGFSERELQVLRQRAEDEIAGAVAFAIDSPQPEIGSLWEDVYA
jgi:TPP-dependent pyruvate/acetoin dehydrogenase alpha subunit